MIAPIIPVPQPKSQTEGPAPERRTGPPESAAGSSADATPSSSGGSAAGRPAARHVRSGSFQRWRRQMQRSWRWGPSGEGSGDREQGLKTSMNLEMMLNQKRQWYQTQSKSKDHRHHKEPTSLFEHFIIVGLHSHANVDAIEKAFAKRKTWETEVAKSEIVDLKKINYQVSMPTLEPQVLFKYPPGKRVAKEESDIPAFCFPEGVKARLLERTPSLSDLNELVFGQEHLARDDVSFIFSLKVSDNATLYGVCLHVQEIVQRAPGILGDVSPLTNSSCKPSRFLVSAPRCYCILTSVPFFELHYEMLNSIVAQERLDRITQFVSEMTLKESISRGPTGSDQNDENSYFPNFQSSTSWMGYAIPVDSVLGLTSCSASLSSDRELPPNLSRQLETHSPECASPSEASDISHTRELDRDYRKSAGQVDDYSSAASSRSDSFERASGSFENCQASPDVGTICSSVSRRLERVASLESVYSSVRGVGSDDDDDDLSSKHEVAGDEKVMEWAKVHNNEPLQIVCGYHSLPLPPRGSEVIFHPLEHLQPIKYCRPGVSSLDLGTSGIDPCTSTAVNEVNAQLAAAEEALALSIWAVATTCRSLSLESVLTLITGALLEKQMIVVCPNLGVLSAIVLSLIPLIRPFEWQSLFLPVLPRKMFDFLDAPVPFIVGVQHKPADIKMKTANLIRVDVYKDQVKGCSLPQLPRHRELISELLPIHARLTRESSTAQRHPVHKCSEVQAEAARQFLNVIKCYMESFCSNLRAHTITNVQSNNDKVSLLLKDSFLDSFPSRERPFMKLLIDTQLFSALSDSRLSTYEHE
ncbi:uncharacterized protein M6B38_391805 [Iris pallida]|uniref:UDENN domain-containing protein n=1 Tax=Iris pallida TaxID=29817 RepID=A0AAX6FZR3_IRIPA|nr:uncharacterized protein M6B38_391805 [Iris pallida]